MVRITTLQEEVGSGIAREVERDAIQASWPPYAKATVQYCAVQIATALPLARTVVRRRLNRAQRLVEFLLSRHIPIYCSLVLRDANQLHIILPPVLEETATGELLVVDGMHRMITAKDHGHSKLFVLKVTADELPPPPLAACSWADIVTVDGKPSSDTNFPGYVPSRFRDTAHYLDTHRGPFRDLDIALSSLRGGAGSSGPETVTSPV